MMKRCTKCGEEKELGEFSPRKTSKDRLQGHCKSCRAKYQRRQYKEDPKGRRTSCYKWQKKNRFARILITSKSDAKRNGYMPCSATSEELKVAFTGRCYICGVPEIECIRHLAMDHNHETGEFRGWLCNKHNKMLGFAGDSREILLNALLYIQRSEAKQKQQQ